MTLALAAEMLQSAGIAGIQSGRPAARRRRAGRAAARRRSSAAWWRRSAVPPISSSTARHIPAEGAGRAGRCRRREPALSPAIATRDIGLAVVALGGGRTRPEDSDRPCGRPHPAAAGRRRVERGEPLALVHARSDDAEAATRVRAAVSIGGLMPVGDTKPAPAKRDRAPRELYCTSSSCRLRLANLSSRFRKLMPISVPSSALSSSTPPARSRRRSSDLQAVDRRRCGSRRWPSRPAYLNRRLEVMPMRAVER